MKELSIKEKAELYDKALERAKNTIEVNQAVPNIVDCVKSLFPELIESEDEEIRKSITEFFKNYSERGTWKAISDVTKWIDWLERHGEQDNNEDVDILHRFSFYSYKDEPNVLYLSGLYVNEEYRNKGIGTKILKVADEVAKSLDCRVIRLKTKRGSDAERLYRTHGYNSLEIEDKDEIWLEKQGERKSLDDIAKESTKNKEAATSFLKSCGIMNANGELADEYKIEQDEQKPTKVEPKFKIGDVIEVKPMKCHDKIFIGKPNKIVDITEKCYILDDGKAYSIEELQDGWKLSEQKSTDNVKPKFKVGDTIAKKHNSDMTESFVTFQNRMNGNFMNPLDKSLLSGVKRMKNTSIEQLILLIPLNHILIIHINMMKLFLGSNPSDLSHSGSRVKSIMSLKNLQRL